MKWLSLISTYHQKNEEEANGHHKEIYFEIKYIMNLSVNMSRHVGYGAAMDFMFKGVLSGNNRRCSQGQTLEVILWRNKLKLACQFNERSWKWWADTNLKIIEGSREQIIWISSRCRKMTSPEESLSCVGGLGLAVPQEGVMLKVGIKYLHSTLFKTEKTSTVYIKAQ